ncbi:hypothetical protein KY290_030455 [Solanum tuberosum]|uniref:M-phase phosphoprotein 6 n=2 Tax=Solanum tuberosum TaxID=4113 RepID=A0ABQ7UQP3_SOLTU|nr:PREDICTED: uncharacterized protein LOC102585757 [Solanum tuberosum]KAH0751223.1 hypothetical protein KY290_030455 [Solanum tuberosum]
MAKRELSGTLRNLKFMQRASLREEKPKKEEEVVPDGNFPSSSAPKRCVIIMEGDPHPGAIKGRMSFQGFNPSIDKLSEEASKPRPEGSAAAAACSSETSERIIKRENGTSQYGLENSDLDDSYDDPNEDLKWKQDNTSSEAQYSNKSHKRVLDVPASSPSSSQRSKMPHRLDWSVLKPPKSQKRRR